MTDKPHFVYALIDPRDGQTFYIGKGSGKRLTHHALEARKCARRGGRPSLKEARILEIEASGQNVVYSTLAEFDSPEPAWALERELIAERDDLTNVRVGHRDHRLCRSELKRRANLPK